MRLLQAPLVMALAFFGTVTASAATFTIENGVIYAYRYISGAGAPDQYDVRGLAQVGVANPGDLGDLLLTDNSGGTDPGFSIIPFGNSALLTIALANSDVGGIPFVFASAVTTPTTLTLQGTGLPIIPNPSTNPAILLTYQLLNFDFNLVNFQAVPGSADFLATYALSGIRTDTVIPEPSTLALVGGVAMLFAIRRRA